MEVQTNLPGVGPATTCSVSPVSAHVPVPVRFVWHHILPQEAGGQTAISNLVQLCDNCHYSIHRLMYYMRLKFEGKVLTADQAALLAKPPRQKQLALATQGYNGALAAGTVSKIPNEG